MFSSASRPSLTCPLSSPPDSKRLLLGKQTIQHYPDNSLQGNLPICRYIGVTLACEEAFDNGSIDKPQSWGH